MPTMSTEPTAAIEPRTPPAPSRRLLSLDALRGFDMFWIVGGEEVVHGLYKAWPNGFSRFLKGQFTHKAWEGVGFYDLIFPLFVFIVGVSLVFSLSRTLEQSGRPAALRRIFFRSLLIYFCGLLVYGGISKGLDHVRWMGVLQRIALTYFFASLLFCFFRLRSLVVICIAMLLGYWAMTALVPIRDFNLEKEHLKAAGLTPTDPQTVTRFYATTQFVRGKYDDGRSLPQHIDFMFLPGYKWDGAYDPEGILSTIPAVCTCLLGVFAGLLLKNPSVPDQKKVNYLALAGVGMLGLGFLWGLQFPVIKKIWTSSYVLVAAGYAALLLALFYQIIEIWQWRRWCTPFVWVGMNALTIYLVARFLEPAKIPELLAGGPIAEAAGNWGDFMLACVMVALMFYFLRWLYNRKIFLRL